MKEELEKRRLPLLGKIPFDLSVTESIVKGKPIVEHANNSVTKAIEEVWHNLS